MPSHNVHIDKVSSCVQTEHAFFWHSGLLKFCYNRDKQSCSIRPPFSVYFYKFFLRLRIQFEPVLHAKFTTIVEIKVVAFMMQYISFALHTIQRNSRILTKITPVKESFIFAKYICSSCDNNVRMFIKEILMFDPVFTALLFTIFIAKETRT